MTPTPNGASILYDSKDEVCHDYGDFFTTKQKKDKYGEVTGKIYLYSKDSTSYYYLTSFATFSSRWQLERFLSRLEARLCV